MQDINLDKILYKLTAIVKSEQQDMLSLASILW